MLQAFVSPLAPAAILLLSALILPAVSRLRTEATAWTKYLTAPVLVSAALAALLFMRVTPGGDAGGDGLELLSGWNFLTTESVAALTIRADILSLSFLIVTLFILLVVSLLFPGAPDNLAEFRWPVASGWLLLGAAACFLFVAANGLTMIYGVMLFDLALAGYWLSRHHRDMAVARLGLGVVTAAGLMATTLADTNPTPWGGLLFGLTLWLRLGLYPLSEESLGLAWHNGERLVYFSLSVLVGLYLAVRGIGVAVPAAIYWLTLVTMLVFGLLAWLSDLFVPTKDEPAAAERTGAEVSADQQRLEPLLWLVLTEALMVLLAAPLIVEVALAFVVGLLLSLLALWVTPQLGKPRLTERAWSWPYLPAFVATLTLVGAPLTLGWVAKVGMFAVMVGAENYGLVAAVIVAEGLALSSLVQYWVYLVRGQAQHTRRSLVSVVIVVPFLTPGLGLFILSALTGTELFLPDPETYLWLLGVTAVVVSLALLFGFYRLQILRRFSLPLTFYVYLLDWSWAAAMDQLLSRASRLILRGQLILEGQHYIGWAIFTALVGTLIILLS